MESDLFMAAVSAFVLWAFIDAGAELNRDRRYRRYLRRISPGTRSGER